MKDHKFTKASKYIERIRNKAKREYAHAYYQYLREPEHLRARNGPDYGELSYMAAQDVRMNLCEIMEGKEGDK